MTLTFDPTTYGELLAQHRPKVISSEAEYDEAIALAEKLEFSEALTPEQDSFLDLLVVLISNYESEHYPIPDVKPIEVLHHLMDTQNLKQEDLGGVIGSRGVVSEVINHSTGQKLVNHTRKGFHKNKHIQSMKPYDSS